ncbi:response regulator [Cohnella ginsengisoli]|uniref:Response regulator n=1 Tax=Cohnella ginsengisoli TaxID=425004 RepID=A0A9X4KFU8_9BACL|nr:response regulator [Cohnella ginsengisoli]MDG0791248.1 response regulator [Cohnella ginsengisoli]
MYELLIVDDHAHLVDSLERNVSWQELGIGKVHKAFSGEEALEFCKTSPVDIVLTDIRMPGISGLELIQQLKKYDKHFKSILLSGYGEWDYAQEAIRQQVDGYLLKPVDHEELAGTVRRLTEALRLEWDERGRQQKAMDMVREHMPLFREKLLTDLLQGRKLPPELLEEKLAYYQLPFRPGDLTAMCLVRIESSAEELNWRDQSLLASAVANIAEETFSDLFQVWHGRDAYDYEVFILKVREETWLSQDPQPELARQQSFEHLASRLQQHVRQFLKSSISIVLGDWQVMSLGLRGMYRDSLAVFARQLGGGTDLLIRLQDAATPEMPYRIHSLYESPTFIQLSEIGQWEAIRSKWDTVFQEVADKGMESRETLLELYYHAMGAFSFFCPQERPQSPRHLPVRARQARRRRPVPPDAPAPGLGRAHARTAAGDDQERMEQRAGRAHPQGAAVHRGTARRCHAPVGGGPRRPASGIPVVAVQEQDERKHKRLSLQGAYAAGPRAAARTARAQGQRRRFGDRLPQAAVFHQAVQGALRTDAARLQA